MHIVAGMSALYTVPMLRNFVVSFKRHVKADLLLILQNTDEATREWIHNAGAASIDLDSNIHPKFGRYFAM